MISDFSLNTLHGDESCGYTLNIDVTYPLSRHAQRPDWVGIHFVNITTF